MLWNFSVPSLLHMIHLSYLFDSNIWANKFYCRTMNASERKKQKGNKNGEEKNLSEKGLKLYILKILL